jgi:hypothetical protein
MNSVASIPNGEIGGGLEDMLRQSDISLMVPRAWRHKELSSFRHADRRQRRMDIHCLISNYPMMGVHAFPML